MIKKNLDDDIWNEISLVLLISQVMMILIIIN